MLRYFLMITLMLMLAACGSASDSEPSTTNDDDSNDPPATVEQVDAQEADAEDTEDENTSSANSFSISITGAETFEFEADPEPVFGCVENDVQIQTFTFSPKLDIYMQSNIEPGTYPLAAFDANAGAGSVEGAVVVSISGGVPEDGGRPNFYFTEPEGEFIIEQMPSDIGERFIGSVTGNLNDNDGDTITITANFDLETTGTYFMDCAF